MYPVQVSKKVVTGRHHLRDFTERNRHRYSSRSERRCWRMRSNSVECFIGNADGLFRAREIWRLEPQDRWDTEAINSVIGLPWRMTE